MKKRVFVSFPIEDDNLRDLLVGQARNDHSPFEFVDMSVKKPWDDSWKTNCRVRIKSCDGLIAIITPHTYKADGQLWEIKCASNELVPVLFIKTSEYSPSQNTLNLIGNKRVYNWDWDTIKSFLNRI